MVIESVQSFLPNTELVFVFLNWKTRFCQDESKTCCFEEFVFDWALCFRLCEGTVY